MLLLGLKEEIAVFEGSFGVVDRAGSYNDKQALPFVGALDNGDGLIAALGDCGFRLGSLGDLGLEQIRGCERVVALDAPIFGLILLTDLLVLDKELERSAS